MNKDRGERKREGGGRRGAESKGGKEGLRARGEGKRERKRERERERERERREKERMKERKRGREEERKKGTRVSEADTCAKNTVSMFLGSDFTSVPQCPLVACKKGALLKMC